MGDAKVGFIAALATAIFFWLINPGQGQESFFRGKTIRVIVGLAPGGGELASGQSCLPRGQARRFDHRQFRRRFGVSANSRPAGGRFRRPKFEYLGVPAQDNFIIGIAKSTGITSIEQWKASGTVLKIRGVAPGGGTDDIPKVVKATLGLPLRMVSG